MPVTVVIPVWNSGKWLAGCLEGLANQNFRDFTVIIVDDGSTDGSTETLEQSGLEVIRLPENRGFATAVNAGVEATSSELVALLNVDTRPLPNWLGALVGRLHHDPPQVGGVASRMLLMEDPERIEDAGNSLSWYGSACKRGRGLPASAFDEADSVFSVCAGAALFRRRFFDDVGLFDPGFGSYFEDLELGLRGNLLGWRFVYEPGAEVLHKGHGSGLRRSRYVSLVTRNRILTFLKGIPTSLLLRHARQLLFGQIYFLLAYRRPLASLVGYLGALWQLPRILGERKLILDRCTLSTTEIGQLLSDELGEPRLRTLFLGKLRSLWRSVGSTGK